MVAEADESDRSFLKLSPAIAVITNIDYEHLDCYGTFDRLREAFLDFANAVPFYGATVACADDEHIRQLLPRMTRRVITYGLDAAHGADVLGTGVQLRPFGASCEVWVRAAGAGPADASGSLHLQVPGHHNLRNALAAVVVGLEVGVAFDCIG